MSRQSDWQRKMIGQGRCQICAREIVGSRLYCLFHREKNRTRSRNRYRKKVGIPLEAELYSRKKEGSNES